jgi:hypothetical protein
MDDDWEWMPLFRELAEEDDEFDPVDLLVGGMARWSDPEQIAASYMAAGHALINHALQNGEPWEVAYPILFVYRHALELYLKSVLRPSKLNHDLAALVSQFESFVGNELQQELPPAFRRYLMEFASMDPGSQSFRYSDARGASSPAPTEPSLDRGEYSVDLEHFRVVMEEFRQGFENLLSELHARSARSQS